MNELMRKVVVLLYLYTSQNTHKKTVQATIKTNCSDVVVVLISVVHYFNALHMNI
jgi:hypothetical protein